ncbi:MAG: hypothetical protein K9N35_10345 [Candidatus Marinimicrobia bacterium]|nr:hypothetical protein [Candidatus Neomarinimicrobiota bacterium]
MRAQKMSTAIFLFVLLSGFTFAQVTSDAAYKTPAMGALMGSNLALSSDGSSLLLNPASLMSVENGFVQAATQNIYNQSFLPYNVLTAGTRLPGGFGMIGLSFESMTVSYQGETLSGETAVGITHAFALRKDRISSLNMGYTVKYLTVDYGTSAGTEGDGSNGMDLGSAEAFGFDLGFQATLSKRHWLGVVVHNVNRPQIGSGSASSMLPRDVQAGFSYAPTREVVTSFSLASSPGLATELHAGLAYALNTHFELRAGIQSQPNRFGTGFSFHAKGIALDYALLTHPILPVTHQFSLAYAFGRSF